MISFVYSDIPPSWSVEDALAYSCRNDLPELATLLARAATSHAHSTHRHFFATARARRAKPK